MQKKFRRSCPMTGRSALFPTKARQRLDVSPLPLLCSDNYFLAACSATRHLNPGTLPRSAPLNCNTQLQSFCRVVPSTQSVSPLIRSELCGRKSHGRNFLQLHKAPRQKCKASNWVPAPQLHSANLSAILNIFYKPVDLCRQTFSPLSRLN